MESSVNNSKAKKYNNIKLAFGIGKGISSFVLIILFIFLGYSTDLVSYISGYSENSYIILLLFVFVIGIISTILCFPLNFYIDFYLEHKYQLSNQTFAAWIWENLKGAVVGSVIGIPILLLFYYILNHFGNLWWLPFAVFLFIISVVLAQIVPVLIMPLFYKITPYENDELKSKIKDLAAGAGLKIENVFQFNMSKNTKKANAAFTGLGKTKRVLLGDTLLENYNHDEIETVLAHEFGHYKYNHIIKNIFIGTVSSFLTLFVLSILYDLSIGWFGFTNIVQVNALPLLAVWGMILGVIQTPITNYISRHFEYQADSYAIEATKKPDAFINTLEKLTDQNLGDKNPHPFVEWFFYSHPSIERRKQNILNLKKLPVHV